MRRPPPAPTRGPTDLKLADTLIAGAVDSVVKEDGAEKGKIPSDMVTASASGLDPHISPANADLQVATGCQGAERPSRRRCATSCCSTPSGASSDSWENRRINVLLLNIALDSAFPRPGSK